MVSSVLYQLWLVCLLQLLLNRNSLATVVHALVVSRLDYVLYLQLPLGSPKLELVWNTAPRLVVRTDNRQLIPQVLKDLY